MSISPLRFTLAVAAIFSTVSGAFAQSFVPLLSTDKLWSLKQDEFQAATKSLPFRWTSSTKDSARAANQGMTLFDLPVYEVVARFEGDALKEITATFYARGDAGTLTKDAYEALIAKSSEAISKATGAKFSERGKDATSAVRADGREWQTAKSRYLLEYSATKEVKTRGIDFRAEFVRLEISPPERKTSLLESASNTARAKFTGAMHVKRDAASGDVWLGDVPMVDQGQKGYCVVASTERVMRYYGNAVDENELAQIANSDAAGGTSVGAMMSSLKKLGSRLRVRVRAVEEQDVKAITDLMKDYNRAAKRAHESEIPDQGHMLNVGTIFAAMKYDVLKDAKTKNKSDLARFQREVQSHIDVGIPVLWCVQLGLSPEPGVPQSGGGHMRLIIGYNTKTQEILFSDSWGAGHELKRMSAADAWTITTGAMTIEPI